MLPPAPRWSHNPPAPRWSHRQPHAADIRSHQVSSLCAFCVPLCRVTAHQPRRPRLVSDACLRASVFCVATMQPASRTVLRSARGSGARNACACTFCRPGSAQLHRCPASVVSATLNRCRSNACILLLHGRRSCRRVLLSSAAAGGCRLAPLKTHLLGLAFRQTASASLAATRAVCRAHPPMAAAARMRTAMSLCIRLNASRALPGVEQAGLGSAGGCLQLLQASVAAASPLRRQQAVRHDMHCSFSSLAQPQQLGTGAAAAAALVLPARAPAQLHACRHYCLGDLRVVQAELSENQFHQLADAALDTLQERLEVYLEDLDVDGADVEQAQGVLTVKLGRHGTYVINKQTPNRQIWLSSPLTGPFRYDYDGGAWVYSRDGRELFAQLQQELKQLLGTAPPLLASR